MPVLPSYRNESIDLPRTLNGLKKENGRCFNSDPIQQETGKLLKIPKAFIKTSKPILGTDTNNNVEVFLCYCENKVFFPE